MNLRTRALHHSWRWKTTKRLKGVLQMRLDSDKQGACRGNGQPRFHPQRLRMRSLKRGNSDWAAGLLSRTVTEPRQRRFCSCQGLKYEAGGAEGFAQPRVLGAMFPPCRIFQRRSQCLLAAAVQLEAGGKSNGSVTQGVRRQRLGECFSVVFELGLCMFSVFSGTPSSPPPHAAPPAARACCSAPFCTLFMHCESKTPQCSASNNAARSAPRSRKWEHALPSSAEVSWAAP